MKDNMAESVPEKRAITMGLFQTCWPSSFTVKPHIHILKMNALVRATGPMPWNELTAYVRAAKDPVAQDKTTLRRKEEYPYGSTLEPSWDAYRVFGRITRAISWTLKLRRTVLEMTRVLIWTTMVCCMKPIIRKRQIVLHINRKRRLY